MFSHYSIAELPSLFFLVMLFLLGGYPLQVAALSEDQKRVFDSGIYYFNTEAGTICSSAGTTALVGSENEEKIFNFFLSKGLLAPQAAGAYGNIMHESSGDPENIQNPKGRSKNPGDAGSGGWGIIQWTPGSKMIDLAKEAGVEGPIYELPTQLELVWQHMNNHPVVTQEFDLAHYKTLNDYKAATAYFEDKIEGAGVVALEERQKLAYDGLTKYGSGGSLANASDSTLCGGSGEVVGNYSLPVAKKWYSQHPEWFTKPHHDYPAADIPVPDGTAVFSVSDGKIVNTTNDPSCGVGMTIDAGDGITFSYCHGSDAGSLPGAKKGDTVKAGQLIMHSSYTGHVIPAGPDGAHLHLGIRVADVQVCPQSLLVGIASGNVPNIKSLPSQGCTTK